MTIRARCVVAMLGAIVLGLPAPALARTIACGEVITANTRVDNDLRCGAPVALQIGDHGVELDLQGHTIEALPYYDESTGTVRDDGTALLNPGYDRVSITNGSVVAEVQNLPVGYALVARDADQFLLRNIVTNGYGSLSVSGDRARLSNVAVAGWSAGIRSDGATIDRLSTRDRIDTDVMQPLDGVFLSGQGVQLTNSDVGVAYLHVDRSVVQRNRFLAGLHFTGNHNVVRGNEVSGDFNGTWSPGWVLDDGTGNRVCGNRVESVSNDDGALQLRSGFAGNVITRNTVANGGADGIVVEAGAEANLVQANSTRGHADDGIDVADSSTTLSDNRAYSNGDFGIEAVEGVTDGGGNRAWDNGNPLQCINVLCQL